MISYSPSLSGSWEKYIYFDFRVNYLHNHEDERPIKTEFVIENLNIYEIQKQTCESSQITMLTTTKAKEMVNKYNVFYYLNVMALDQSDILLKNFCY